MIRVFLADDHDVVLRGLRALIGGEPDLEVVGDESSGARVAEAVLRARPDVLVLDLLLPGMPGLEVARQVRRDCPSTRVVVLSMHSEEAYVHQALRAGACAYVLKCSESGDVVRAIREAAAGRQFLAPPLSAVAIEEYGRSSASAGLDMFETLTPREREVFVLVAECCSSSEIAARLGISARTADTHRARILRKLGLRGHAELVRYALERGISPLRGEDRGAGPPR